MQRIFNILLYIETGGPGGAEKVLLDIATNLDRTRFNPMVILHKDGWLNQQLVSHGIVTKIIPSKRAWDLAFIRQVVNISRRLKIDLIHSHLFGANMYACLSGAILRIPVITTFHNELALPGGSERYLKLKNFIIRKLAAKMVFVADYLIEEYERTAKYPKHKLTTIFNGITLESESDRNNQDKIRQELQLQNDELLIGHVANFRHAKGHQYLVSAANKICQKIPNAQFLLVGLADEGQLKKDVEKQIAKLGLEGNIKLLGFRNDVQQLLGLFDIFVMSSISEGLPLSVIEAMAASKPVVATNVGGLPEAVFDNETGFLVQPRDPIALADKLLILLRNKDLRIRMGQAGRRAVEMKFSLTAMMRNYENLYQQLIK